MTELSKIGEQVKDQIKYNQNNLRTSTQYKYVQNGNISPEQESFLRESALS